MYHQAPARQDISSSRPGESIETSTVECVCVLSLRTEISSLGTVSHGLAHSAHTHSAHQARVGVVRTRQAAGYMHGFGAMRGPKERPGGGGFPHSGVEGGANEHTNEVPCKAARERATVNHATTATQSRACSGKEWSRHGAVTCLLRYRVVTPWCVHVLAQVKSGHAMVRLRDCSSKEWSRHGAFT